MRRNNPPRSRPPPDLSTLNHQPSRSRMAETKTPEYLGTGRRKTAIARVRLASGTGKITVNGRPFENYFPVETLRGMAAQPLTAWVMSFSGWRARTSATVRYFSPPFQPE